MDTLFSLQSISHGLTLLPHLWMKYLRLSSLSSRSRQCQIQNNVQFRRVGGRFKARSFDLFEFWQWALPHPGVDLEWFFLLNGPEEERATKWEPGSHECLACMWCVRWCTAVTSLGTGKTAERDGSVISKEHQKETGWDHEEKGSGKQTGNLF